MTGQGSLFDERRMIHDETERVTYEPVRFDGETYDAEKDAGRLTGQLAAVYAIMADGKWRTLPQLQLAVEARTGKKPREQSISARLRDLRKRRFGKHEVKRRRVVGGVFEYRLLA